jgi:hypothetical protein
MLIGVLTRQLGDTYPVVTSSVLIGETPKGEPIGPVPCRVWFTNRFRVQIADFCIVFPEFRDAEWRVTILDTEMEIQQQHPIVFYIDPRVPLLSDKAALDH